MVVPVLLTLCTCVCVCVFVFVYVSRQVPHFIDSGFANFFKCNNKGCDPTQPVALSLEDPSSATSAFKLSFPVMVPKPQHSGHYHLVVWAQDQTHACVDWGGAVVKAVVSVSVEVTCVGVSCVSFRYDFSATIAFALNCDSDSQCPEGSYCETYKHPPTCH